MENTGILIDTCIVIEHLRKQNKTKTILFKFSDKYKYYISAISVFELFSGAITSTKKSDIAGEIYKKLRKMNNLIEISDILIAANSIEYNLPFLTLNTKHFERIENLKLLNFNRDN